MVRYARYEMGTSKIPQAATSWEDLKLSSSSQGESITQQPPEHSSSSKVVKKQKLSHTGLSKGLSGYDSDVSDCGKTCTGIATQLEEIAPAPASIEIIPDKQKSTKLKSKTKNLSNKKTIKEEVERIKAANQVNLSKEDEQHLEDCVKKDQRREERRLDRQTNRQQDKICFNCREAGHTVSDCPKVKGDMKQGTGICFKCGSTEHAMQRCRLRLPAGEFPYAKCFICGEMGHLSSQCPDNPRGLYPNGGCCKLCGSVEHYRKDCTEHMKQQGIADFKLGTISNLTSADGDDGLHETEKIHTRRKGPKVVKF